MWPTWLKPSSRRQSARLPSAAPTTWLARSHLPSAELLAISAGAVASRTRFVPVPLAPVVTAIRVYERLSKRPRIRAEQLLRLAEDKAFRHRRRQARPRLHTTSIRRRNRGRSARDGLSGWAGRRNSCTELRSKCIDSQQQSLDLVPRLAAPRAQIEFHPRGAGVALSSVGSAGRSSRPISSLPVSNLR